MKYSAKKKSIVLVAILLILSLCLLAGCNSGSDIDSKPPADTFKIIKDKAKSIEYTIPKRTRFIKHITVLRTVIPVQNTKP